jgi:hypothetical protein
MRNGLPERSDLYAVVKTEPSARAEGPLPPRVSRESLEPLFTGLVTNFRQTAYFVYLLYKASFGRAPGFAEFIPEVQMLKYDPVDPPEKLESSKAAYVQAWVNRADFKSKYGGLDDEQFVDALLAQTGLTKGPGNRDQLVSGLHSGALTRPVVLRNVIDNNAFAVREFNRAFVLMHYFAYLKRDPDEGGFQFWLYKLDRYTDYPSFTEAFAASTERQLKLDQK